eukprot:805503-Amphidinium_carterae.1
MEEKWVEEWVYRRKMVQKLFFCSPIFSPFLFLWHHRGQENRPLADAPSQGGALGSAAAAAAAV